MIGPIGIIPPPIDFPVLTIGDDGQATRKPDDSESEASRSDSDDEQSSTKTPESSETSSSASSCTQSVATRQVVSCSTVVGSDSTQTFTESCTTATSTITGCEVTGFVTSTISTTTVSETAASTNYIIIPQDNASADDRKAFDASLKAQIGNAVQSTDDDSGIALWLAPLNASYAAEIQASSTKVISAVIADATLGVEDIDDNADELSVSTTIAGEPSSETATVSKRGLRTQFISPAELRVVSQGPKDDLNRMLYQYDDTPGSTSGTRVTVYMLDSGANPQNPEFANMPGSKSWLFPGFEGVVPIDSDQDDKWGHGACVLSKISGPTYGVAKNVDIVIVKLQAKNKKGRYKLPASNLAKALIEVKHDIEKKNLQNRAVINMSFGSKFPSSLISFAAPVDKYVLPHIPNQVACPIKRDIPIWTLRSRPTEKAPVQLC